MPDLNLTTILDYLKNNYGLLIRYAVSGFAGVFANLIVFSLAIELFGIWYIFAALWGFVAAYIVTFLMHKFWTFSKTGMDRTLAQSILYLFSALATLAINTALLYVQVELFNIWPIVAQALALGISAVLSFVFTSQVTFHVDENRLETLLNKVTSYSKQTRVLFLLLIVIGVFFMGLRLLYMPVTVSDETVKYVATAEQIFGIESEFYGMRYLKPLAPALVGVIATVTGGDYDFAIIIEAQLGYFALVFAVFWFGVELFGSRSKALLLSIIVTTTYPIVRYGLNPITETGAWAFYFAALAALIRWSNTLQTKWLWLTSFLLLGGVLWKEYSVLAGIVFGLVIITHPIASVRHKIMYLLQGAFLILIPWAMWQWHVYDAFQYSYLDWLALGSSPEAYQSEYSLPSVTKSLFAMFTLSWLFVPLAWKYKDELSDKSKKFLLLLLVPSFGFLLWGWVSSRLFFSLVPLIAPLAVLGLGVFSSYRSRLLVVLCIGFINLGLVWFAHIPEVRELIDAFTYGR